MTLIVHDTDPSTIALIDYYKKRLESTEIEYQQALDSIDAIKICKLEEGENRSWRRGRIEVWKYDPALFI